MPYNEVVSLEVLNKTAENLNKRNLQAVVVKTAEEAKQKVLELIPKGADVMAMTSETLNAIGLTEIFSEDGEYLSVKKQLSKLNRETDQKRMQELGAAPTYAVGSVHAITQDGQVLIASNTGSQLPAYAYAAQHVIWVVGGQKITTDFNDAMKRLESYVLPLESERARKAYGVEGSNISKLLIFNNEVMPNRVHVILVAESLGF
jgi:L-lactate utilization protein LutC